MLDLKNLVNADLVARLSAASQMMGRWEEAKNRMVNWQLLLTLWMLASNLAHELEGAVQSHLELREEVRHLAALGEVLLLRIHRRSPMGLLLMVDNRRSDSSVRGSGAKGGLQRVW